MLNAAWTEVIYVKCQHTEVSHGLQGMPPEVLVVLAEGSIEGSVKYGLKPVKMRIK